MVYNSVRVPRPDGPRTPPCACAGGRVRAGLRAAARVTRVHARARFLSGPDCGQVDVPYAGPAWASVGRQGQGLGASVRPRGILARSMRVQAVGRRLGVPVLAGLGAGRCYLFPCRRPERTRAGAYCLDCTALLHSLTKGARHKGGPTQKQTTKRNRPVRTDQGPTKEPTHTRNQPGNSKNQ